MSLRVFFFFWVTKYYQIHIPFKFIQIAAYSFHKGICDYLIFFFFITEYSDILESFGLILQNWKLICVIGTVQSYLGFWGERLNFGITIAEIQPKVWERRRKMWREKMLNFGNGDTEFPLPNSAARAWSARSEKEKIKK